MKAFLHKRDDCYVDSHKKKKGFRRPKTRVQEEKGTKKHKEGTWSTT